MQLLGCDVNEINANTLGELLRENFWDQSDDTLGCYSSFNYREGVIESTIKTYAINFFGPDDLEDWDDYAEEASHLDMHQAYRLIGDGIAIDCYWYWDGDGVLAFRIMQRGRVIRTIINTDCKKTYEWRDQ